MHKNVEIFFLQLNGDFGSHLLIFRRADNGSEARCCTIDKLNPALTKNDIVCRSKPEIFCCRVLGLGVKIRGIQIANGLKHLLGKIGCHTGIQGRGKVGQPQVFCDNCRQQFATFLEYILHVTKFFHLGSEHGVDDRQKICCVWKGDFLIRAIFFNGFFI